MKHLWRFYKSDISDALGPLLLQLHWEMGPSVKHVLGVLNDIYKVDYVSHEETSS